MAEQLRLEGIVVPCHPFRLSPATCLLGEHWIAECRAVLADAVEKSLDGCSLA